MVVAVRHSKVVTVPDDGTSPVGSDEWNAGHVITGLENVQNVDTTNLSNITSGTLSVSYGERINFIAGNTSSIHGPFALSVFDAGNPYLDIGYNILADEWTLINPLDKGVFFGQEGDYDDGSGHHKMEQYWQYQKVSGQIPVGGHSTYVRTVMAQYDKVTDLPTALLLSAGAPNGVIIHWNDGTGDALQEQVIGKPKGQFLNNLVTVWNQPGAVQAALVIDSTTASAATGLALNCLAAGSGMGLAAISTATNETLTIDAKGSGSIVLAPNSTGAIISVPAFTVSNTTPSTVPGNGSLTVGGGAGIAGNVNAGGTVTGAGGLVSLAAFTAAASLTSTINTSINNGANAALPVGTGLLMIAENSTSGNWALVTIGGGGIAPTILYQSSAGFYTIGTTPAAGHAGIAFDGTALYRVYNNIGAAKNFSGLTLICRASN